jgi:probable O-glycosylation ligase (exosortase A-associated)
MRDVLLLLVMFGGLIATLRYPFVGVILWAWFSIMTPHQMAYGAFGLQLNTIIAVVTIISIIANGEYSRFRFGPIPILLCLFALSLTFSQMFSLLPANSAPYYDRFIKILLFIFIAMQLANTRLRAHALLWTLTLGIGYFAAKGALFTLATLGQFRVQGLQQTVLEDNNHMGIAMATLLPIILYLREQSAAPLVRRGLLALFALTVFAIIGTQSRGAFISLVVFGSFFWWRSKRKLLYVAAALMLAVPAISFMPSNWTDRMSTIKTASEDSSFQGRVDAWIVNTSFALEYPLTGAGLRNPYDKELATKVNPIYGPKTRAAHSIYFEVLGGAGFIALAIFVGMLATAFFTAQWLTSKRAPPNAPDWTRRYGYYAQISLAVFGVGGASTSMEMWDGYLLIIAMTAVAARIAREYAQGEIADDPRYSWRGAARGTPLATPTRPRRN